MYSVMFQLWTAMTLPVLFCTALYSTVSRCSQSTVSDPQKALRLHQFSTVAPYSVARHPQAAVLCWDSNMSLLVNAQSRDVD